MRQYREFTARNLLRKPLVLGVPLFGILSLSFVVLAMSLLVGQSQVGNFIAITVGTVGYTSLRLFTRFGKPGWEDALLYRLVYWTRHKREQRFVARESDGVLISAESPDTLDETQLISTKEAVREKLENLKEGVTLTVYCSKTTSGGGGAQVREWIRETSQDHLGVLAAWKGYKSIHTYSLYQLPVYTDPLWLFGVISRLEGEFELYVSYRKIDAIAIKRQVELSRKANASVDGVLSNVDSDITFAESTKVLEGISRGDETLIEACLTIVSDRAQKLDPTHFVLDTHPRDQELATLSAAGLRRQFSRSLLIRSITASDLYPNIADGQDLQSISILKTVRGEPLFFNPLDLRLEALHWVVVGASGSGKSFFTGCVLHRMRTNSHTQASVLFLDHNRSFRRYVGQSSGKYLEPKNLSDLQKTVPELFDHWNTPLSVSGIELSDLDLADKKAAAFKILSLVETFLRFRETTHPVYVVLDECWQWMRDEPVMVQRAFREYRKLNGAVIAITQSLSDFLIDQSGQSIFQNAPVRILLRQGEDLTSFKSMLGLNEVELAKTRHLRQVKGEYAECLIKTPFMSKIGRLYPSQEEYEIFRTDNLREELVAQAKAARCEVPVCQLT